MEEEKLLWFISPGWESLLDRPVEPSPVPSKPGDTVDAPPVPNPVEGCEYVYGFLIPEDILDAYCKKHPIPGQPVPINKHPFEYAAYKHRAVELLGDQMDFKMYVDPQHVLDPHSAVLAWFTATKNGVVRRFLPGPPTEERLRRFAKVLEIPFEPKWHQWGHTVYQY